MLTIEPKTVDFGRVLVDQRVEKLVRVVNAGRGDLEWTRGSSGEFFTVQRVAGGLRIRHHGRSPGRYHGSVWLRSNGGELTFDVEIEVLSPTATPQPPNHVHARVAQGLAGRRRLLVTSIALLLVATIGILGGWMTRPRPARPPLEALLADFTSVGFPQGMSARFTAECEYQGEQLAMLQELNLQRGLRWRAKHRRTGQELEVRVYEFLYEFLSEGQARQAQDRNTICPSDTDSTTFDTSSITTSKGRQCRLPPNRPLGASRQVQEVTFVRGPRLYKLKLGEISPSASPPPDMILHLARIQAAVAR